MSKSRISLCNIPRQVPLEWVDFQDYSHFSVVEFSKFIDALPSADQIDLLGQINGLKALASYGRIPRKSSQFENVALYPDLYEMKWTFCLPGKVRTEIRQYHAEPATDPKVLIALHMHLKNLNGSVIEIRIRQNFEISWAKMRLEAGRKVNWVL